MHMIRRGCGCSSMLYECWAQPWHLVLPADAVVAAQQLLLKGAVSAQAGCPDLRGGRVFHEHRIAIQYANSPWDPCGHRLPFITGAIFENGTQLRMTHSAYVSSLTVKRTSLHAWCSQLDQSRLAPRQWSYA